MPLALQRVNSDTVLILGHALFYEDGSTVESLQLNKLLGSLSDCPNVNKAVMA